jgi:hypothetical protein
MSTFTVCFCGTDCWPDDTVKDPGHAQRGAFGRGGYIPSKIYTELQAPAHRKAVVPGPGKPYFHYWRSLWVPCTVKDPFAFGDTTLGTSMWDLAGHAAARVVGVPSLGRKQSDLLDLSDPEIVQGISGVRTQVGADLRPDSTAKPPSNNRYQWSPEMLDLLLGSAHASSQAGKITRINLIGHSRGGVAAIMCSHELAYLFPDAEVNIFAIDPVPGAGSVSKEMASLGSTVKNYVGVYAVDECSSGFNGVIPRPTVNGAAMDPLESVQSWNDQIKVPNYHLVWSPGRHATVAGNQTSDGKTDASMANTEASHIGHLVYSLARACLTRWGSKLAPVENLPSASELKQLMGQDAAKAIYRNMRQSTYVPVSIQHRRERGVFSSDGVNPFAWSYLEDFIGETPLMPRGGIHVAHQPGKVVWYSISGLQDKVFTSTSKLLDGDFGYTGSLA